MFPKEPEKYMVARTIGAITTISLPFWRYNVARVGARATIVKLATGRLAVFSPVPLRKPVEIELQKLGNDVGYIIAPDIEHHMALPDWQKAFPDARVIGPEGLPEKRQKQGDPPINFSFIFSSKLDSSVQKIDGGDTSPGTLDAEFEYEYVPSHVNREIVFFHKPQRTLIQADLIFNLPATEQFSVWDANSSGGGLAKWLGSGGSATGNNTLHRSILWYVFSASNRTAFNKSMDRINQWSFDSIIPCHGDVIESGGKKVFEDVMRAHINQSAALKSDTLPTGPTPVKAHD